MIWKVCREVMDEIGMFYYIFIVIDVVFNIYGRIKKIVIIEVLYFYDVNYCELFFIVDCEFFFSDDCFEGKWYFFFMMYDDYMNYCVVIRYNGCDIFVIIIVLLCYIFVLYIWG